MESTIAIIGIFVKNWESVPELNKLLTEHGEYIIGRLGIPYHNKHINVISIVIDAPEDIVKNLCEKIGKLDGINSKLMCDSL